MIRLRLNVTNVNYFSVFKVFHIEEAGFRERMDLRVGRMNLNYSCNDVAWHPTRGELRSGNYMGLQAISPPKCKKEPSKIKKEPLKIAIP